jgi:hypothetical protein
MNASRRSTKSSGSSSRDAEELYDLLDYHAYETKLDELFASEQD